MLNESVSLRNSVEHAPDGEWGYSIDFGVSLLETRSERSAVGPPGFSIQHCRLRGTEKAVIRTQWRSDCC
jgi:hypothetical protein